MNNLQFSGGEGGGEVKLYVSDGKMATTLGPAKWIERLFNHYFSEIQEGMILIRMGTKDALKLTNHYPVGYAELAKPCLS